MHIYSQKIIRFIQEITFQVKSILRDEIGLRVYKEGFYDFKEQTYYPIQIVIFNDQNALGYFDRDFYELAFHQCLMNVSKEQLKNTIRHEVAHYIVSIMYGNTIASHGAEFRAFCRTVGWGKEVYEASSPIEPISPNEKESSILQKVKKLMALSSSSNSHEAELAMIKAQQLLLKHNISLMNLEDETSNSENLILKRILKQKKKNAKMQTIARILGTFFVSTVYNRGGKYTCLEILGTHTNVQIAEYVSDFLQSELDILWKKAKTEHGLKGKVPKNSFFLGIAKGYLEKIDRLKKNSPESITHALIKIEGQIEEIKNAVYRRLVSTTGRTQHCPLSSKLGKEAGNSLSIHPAVNSSNQGQTVLLT